MTFWHRLIGAALLFGLVSLLAQLVDWWLAHRELAPEVATRFRVLRRGDHRRRSSSSVSSPRCS